MKNPKVKKSYLFLCIAIILFLIISNFLIASYYRNGLKNIIWFSDEPLTISVARSYQENGNFKLHLLRSTDLNFPRSTDLNYGYSNLTDAIKISPSIIHDYTAKGPIHFIFLGSFYKLLGTTTKDFFFHGSIFSNICSSFFLVIFFIFLEKKFNFKIAFFSSVLVLIMPFFNMVSARVTQQSGLFFIFSLLPLFFLEKKKIHYFFFGAFSGLSQLVHPFGIFMGFSYALYLLIHREFKGFFITIIGWHIVLLPLFIKNYYLYHDIGWGLWIPFSSKLTYFFSIFDHNANHVVEANYIPNTVLGSIGSVEPFQTLIGLLTDSTFSFISYLMIFIALISIFAFLKIEKLRVNIKYMLLPFLALSYVLVYYSHNAYLQITFAFGIPIVVVYFLYNKNTSMFEKTLPRLYYFIIFFVFIYLIGYYLTAIILGEFLLGIRELIFPIFVLIPIMIFGVNRLLQHVGSTIQNKFTKEKLILNNFDKLKYALFTKNKTRQIVGFLILGLILSPVMIQMIQGLKSDDILMNNHEFFEENSQIVATNNWVNSNIHNQNVASNIPAYSYLKTGLDSITTPSEFWSQVDQELFLAHYNVSYIIFYDLEQHNPDQSSALSFYSSIMNNHTPYLTYSQVFVNGSSYVFKVTNNVETSSIAQPDLYLAKAYLEELNGKMDTARKIYDEVSSYEQTSTIALDESICGSFQNLHKYDYAIKNCNSLLEKDGTNLIALSNLAYSYQKTGQKENTLEILAKYDNMFMNKPEDITLKDSWTNLMNNLIGYDDSYKKIVINWLDKANNLEEKGDNQNALIIYKRTQDVNEFTTESLKSQIRVLAELKQYDDANAAYDLLISTLENKMENRLGDYETLKQSLTDTLYQKAMFSTNIHDYDKAADTYLEIERLNMFDKNAHQKRADVLEQSDDLNDALTEYRFLNHMEPNNQEFIQKINSLTAEITK